MKKTLYPKTQRITNNKIIITEKLDGSNLGIFNIGGELIIAQRNNIYKISEVTKDNSYKGLKYWLDNIIIDLHEGSGIFGEWLGMGHIKYGENLPRFNIFAKVNIDIDYNIRNINYDYKLFKYPFSNSEIPKGIGIVPIITEVNSVNISFLDKLYIDYSKSINRNVEGFIINNNNSIIKYVRHKNGKQTDHTFSK